MRTATRLLLGLVFVFAGWIKVRDPQAFADGIDAYRILPEAWVSIFALALPTFEVGMGVWLLSGWRLRTASFCAASALIVFLGAVGSARMRGLQIDCACFGGVDLHGWMNSPAVVLTRDLVLTAAALLLYISTLRQTKTSWPVTESV